MAPILTRFDSNITKNRNTSDVLLEWQPMQNNFLAVSSRDSKSFILYNRQTDKAREISLPGPCKFLAWSRDGTFMTVACWNGGDLQVMHWSASSSRMTKQELTNNDPSAVTWIGWCPIEDVLAITYASGNVLLVDKAKEKSIVVRGVHDSTISEAVWSADGSLATCSITLGTPKKSRMEFTAIDGKAAHPGRDSPYGQLSRLQFAASRFAYSNTVKQNTLSAIANNRTLVLFDIEEESRTLQYSFKSDYGDLLTYCWYGDGYMVIGFQRGVIIWVSSHPEEHGKEMQHLNLFQTDIVDLVPTLDATRIAVASVNVVRILYTDTERLRQADAAAFDDGIVQKLSWTSDGVLVAGSSTKGEVVIFLARVPEIAAVWNNTVAYMTSLSTFTIAEGPNYSAAISRVDIKLEPDVVALGPSHFAVATTNTVSYYLWRRGADILHQALLLGSQDFSSTVVSLAITSQAAALLLSDGKISLHNLLPSKEEFATAVSNSLRTVPGIQDTTCISLSSSTVYFGTQSGFVGFVHMDSERSTVVLRHTAEIRRIVASNHSGLVAFVDTSHETFIFSLLTNACFKLAGLTVEPTAIVFDSSAISEESDSVHHFVVTAGSKTHLFAFLHWSVHGSLLEEVENAPQDQEKNTSDGSPLLFTNDQMLLLSNGAIRGVRLPHYPDGDLNSDTKRAEALDKLIRLHSFKRAAGLCVQSSGLSKRLEEIGDRCLKELDVQLATTCYRSSGRSDKVRLLEYLSNMEDADILAGSVALINGETDLAKECFLKAGDPVAVLNICSDLQEWDQALELAEKYAPEKVGFASLQHALQLQLMGDDQSAYQYLTRALEMESGGGDTEIVRQSKAALAKLCLKKGELHRGLSLCRELGETSLVEECAVLLEESKRYLEAGHLYQEAGHMSKAATSFLKAREWSKAEELIATLEEPHLTAELAKALEMNGDFTRAVQYYEAAAEHSAVVRLLLEALNRIELAIEYVDRTSTADGARLIANYFMKTKDYPSAIKYLIMSNRGEEAFLIAQQHDQIDIFAELMNGSSAKELCQKIAAHFEKKRDILRAAQFWMKAGSPQTAVDQLIQQIKSGRAENEDSLLELLVKAAVKCNNPTTAESVAQFLLGGDDENPKSEKYLLDLYLLSEQYGAAEKSALLVADHYLRNADYKDAHQILFKTYSTIVARNVRPSGELFDLFALVHSHAISGVIYAMKDHEKVARLLIRICTNMNRFPKDAGRFLLSAVLECSRCQLNRSAAEFALKLMQSEYKSIVGPKHEVKILNILRKSDRASDVADQLTDCPFGDHKLAAYTLFCSLCKLRVPFCILTGAHVIRDDLTVCPHCRMPVTYSALAAAAAAGVNSCPACDVSWTSTDFALLNESEKTKLLRVFT